MHAASIVFFSRSSVLFLRGLHKPGNRKPQKTWIPKGGGKHSHVHGVTGTVRLVEAVRQCGRSTGHHDLIVFCSLEYGHGRLGRDLRAEAEVPLNKVMRVQQKQKEKKASQGTRHGKKHEGHLGEREHCDWSMSTSFLVSFLGRVAGLERAESRGRP